MASARTRKHQMKAFERTAGDELRECLRQCRTAILYMIILGLFYNLLFLSVPLYSMQVYNRVLSSGHVESLVMLTVIAVLALLCMGALDVARGFMVARVGRWIEMRLAPKLIAWGMQGRLLGKNPGNVQPLRELAAIRMFIGGTALGSMCDAPWSPVFLVVVYLIHPLLAAIGAFAAIILLGAALLNEFVSRGPMKDAAQLANENARRAELAIRNADVFHSMGMFPGFVAAWTERNLEVLASHQSASDRNAIILGITKFTRLAAQVFLMGTAAYLVLNGEMSSGGIIAVSMLIARSLSPFEQAIGSWKSFVAARDAHERLTKFLDLVPSSETRMALPAAQGNVSCENVMYAPRGGAPMILNGISFSLQPGTVLGVLGPSGSGKSTLCRILVGVSQPSYGHMRLDGADLSAWPSQQLGRSIGYLPQEIELYEGTISSNIARLQRDFDPEAVVRAATIAGIHKMILRLPDGYETEIGESGACLSGGQRQRIGLARALYGEPKLIVLDEPNASLDVEGEAALLTAIETAKGWGATVVIVAHQPHILKPAQKLLVIRDGNRQLFGDRDEVLRSLGVMRGDSDRPIPARPELRVAPTPTERGLPPPIQHRGSELMAFGAAQPTPNVPAE